MHRALILILGLLTALPCWAQNTPWLSGSISPTVLRRRSLAPWSARVQFNYRGSRILEGRLRLTMTDDAGVATVYETQDLALVNGTQSMRVLVPSGGSMYSSQRMEIRAHFLCASGEVPLTGITLATPYTVERAFVIAVGERLDGVQRDDAMQKVASSLRLERFDAKTTAPTARSLATSTAYVVCAEFDTQPLGYCQYDMVALGPDAFGEMREKQLDALKLWVQAGGSLCVIPGGALKNYHGEFLNALTGARLDLGLDGAVRSGLPAKGIGMYRCELGRVAVAARMPKTDEEFDSPEWRGMSAFLWKFRATQMGAASARGEWDPAQQQADPNQYHYNSGVPQPLPVQPISFRPFGFRESHLMLTTLMPQGVRLVPMSMVIVFLVAFLLVIGPGDYLILGRLRKRKYTWVLLPAVCVGFTALLVGVSTHYVGRKDHRRAITFVDVGSKGQVLRRTRCDLLFAGGMLETETPVRNALFSDLNTGVMGNNYGYGRGGEQRESKCLVQGRMPTEYVVAQQLAQWAPQVNRITSIAGDKPAFKADWAAARVAAFAAEAEQRNAVKERLLPSGSIDGAVILCRGNEMHTLFRDRDFTTRDMHSEVSYGRMPGMQYHDPYGNVSNLTSFEQMLARIGTHPQWGLFSVVSAIAPTGGNTFEDLSILDPTDPNQALLMVVRAEGNDIVIYRRLYHGKED